jgi:hypothetical protein
MVSQIKKTPWAAKAFEARYAALSPEPDTLALDSISSGSG